MKLNVKGVPEGIKVSIGKVAPAELRLGIRKIFDFSFSCDEITTVRGPFRSLRSLKRTKEWQQMYVR